jgi:phosphoribosyl-AMP cyclohydrolase / phosphoribosyl-ATP pyrophosphohydrolase
MTTLTTLPPNFEKLSGLLPAVVQDAVTDKVLMLGFMNPEAYDKTLESGLVTFFSRSRKQLWTKGETSGNFLRVKEILTDCDNDTLLIKALPDGPVCHTGADTCFNEMNQPGIEFLQKLEAVIESRRDAGEKESYTARLLAGGPRKAAKKVGEEAVELAMEADNPDTDRFLDEAADLVYHLQVLLAARNLKLGDVGRVLAQRHSQALQPGQ